MKILNTLLLLAFLTASGNAIAANLNESQNRHVKDFSAIKVSSGIDLYLSMDDHEALRIVADHSIIDDVVTEVKNGTLHIYMKRKNWLNWGNSKSRKAYVSVKQLEALHASSGSDVESENTLRGDKLEVSASSGGDVSLDLHYKNFSIDASSGSDAELFGKVKYLDAEASSGSDIDAEKLEAQFCRVSASSGSDIRVSVSDELEAKASSGADIIYYGSPKTRDIDKSSGGDVRSR